jgi:hypothetical protein
MMQWFFRLSVLFTVANAAATCTTHDDTQEGNIFDQEQHKAFQRDGLLVVPFMLDPILVQNLEHAASVTVENTPKIPFYFSVTKQGAMFRSLENSNSNSNSTADADADGNEGDVAADAFRQAALFSNLPRAAAELMQLDPDTQNLRILR